MTDVELFLCFNIFIGKKTIIFCGGLLNVSNHYHQNHIGAKGLKGLGSLHGFTIDIVNWKFPRLISHR